jgi:hypothetical protein
LVELFVTKTMVLDFERRKSRVWTVDGNRVSPDQRTPGEGA